MEHPNTVVVPWELGVIMDYLSRVYDEDNTLGPRGDAEQDRVDFDKWKYVLVTTVAPMSGQWNWLQ
jgi:glutathione S-transferase